MSAVLSRTTTASEFKVNLFKVKSELYGCTTTSGELSQLGNTEYVWTSFLGKWSFNLSNKYEHLRESVGKNELESMLEVEQEAIPGR